MRKYLFRVVIIVAVVWSCDRTIGYILYKMLQHAEVADNGRNNYINHTLQDDVIFLGSSRCLHHYIPRIFEDSLSLSCYNGGTDGMGIILNYVHAQFIINRYLPKCIVYEVTPHNDYSGTDNSRYLKWLKSDYDEAFVQDIVRDVDSFEYYKMFSYFYRVNDNVVETIRDYSHSMIHDYDKGFTGVSKEMNYDPEIKPIKSIEIDSVKLKYMERLILLCQKKNVPLVFCISPIYKLIEGQEYKPIYQLAEKYSVPLLNHSKDSLIFQSRELFGDPQHLNIKGAEIYSRIVSGELNALLSGK